MSLVAVLDKARAADAKRALKLLLDAWRKKPAPELADAILAIDPTLPALTGATLQETRQLLEVAAREPPDPRTSRALEQLLLEVPFSSDSSKPTWTAAFALLGTLGDPRLAALTPAFGVRASMKGWLERAFARTVRDLPKEAPKLAPDEAKALTALREALSAPAKPAKKTKTLSGDDLLAAIYAVPHDDGPRQVYGDYLLENGDRRGDLIALQLAAERRPAEEKKLLKQHGKAWLGALAPALGAEYEFRRGFVAVGTIKLRHQADAERYGSLVEWATLEELTWSHPNPIPRGQEPWCRFIGPAFRWLKIARGPWPRHLLAAKQPWAIEELDTTFSDLEDFASIVGSPLLPKLQRLHFGTYSRMSPGWLKQPKAWGAIRELGIGYGGWELVEAAEETPVESVLVGGAFRFTRAKDRSFRHLRVEPGHAGSPRYLHALSQSLPAGTLESVEYDPALDEKARASFAPLVEGKVGGGRVARAKPTAKPFEVNIGVAAGFDADGSWLVCEENRLVAVAPRSREIVREVAINSCKEAALTPDGRWLLTWSYRHGELHDVTAGKRVLQMELEAGGGEGGAAITPDARFGALGVEKSTELWDLRAGKRLHAAKSYGDGIAIAPDGSRWATGGVDCCVVYTPGVKKPLVLRGHKGWTKGIVFLPDGRVVAGDQGGEVHAWDATTGELVGTGKAEWPQPMAASPDGKRIAAASDGHVVVLDAGTLKEIARWKWSTQRGVVALAFSPDGKQLLVVHGILTLLNAATGKPVGNDAS